MSQPSLTVDVVSDVVCPWCFVGKRQLARALALRPDVAVTVRWRPYQLDPTIPPGGLDRREYMLAKFGNLDRLQEVHARLIELGGALGIDFHFDGITRSPNTLDAHRLIRWAAQSGAQEAIVERLFNLYFVEGSDVGDRNVLCAAAEAAGLDAAAVAARLAGEDDRASVVTEIAEAARIGVTGVPFFIFAGRYALSGAHPAETLASIIDKILVDTDA
ncbi:DsbA family oxidoreductase [Methylovirgula sp. 4M-Z18]|uniref:DsbA family oxidoreductase n=1 Tax=Methylovirgula sp. 4M-Z18 TaxID=2293567 RepID=UPI000E2E6F70|nr:DsbA family oxidoreductase [Methylovirgula sp. 4M-Z18]RFB79427.1 DsbA family oxidoreductase [Methylovirgula sp. 4M-Z18]